MPQGDDILKFLEERKQQQTKSIEIPEWSSDPKKPLVAYYAPATPRDNSDASRLAQQFGREDDNFAITVALLVIRLRDEKGDRIFKDDALPRLMQSSYQDELNRIVTEVRKGSTYEAGVKAAKKKSPPVRN